MNSPINEYYLSKLPMGYLVIAPHMPFATHAYAFEVNEKYVMLSFWGKTNAILLKYCVIVFDNKGK